ncbi:MAG: LuxR C-terminal-related transcriptional regulator [Chloroflexota bacterium]
MPDLPRTKFTPPALRQDTLPRPALAAWLKDELPESRLLLVCAPAGYGKTTLLAGLPQVCPEYRLAWLNLEAEDDDPVRFLAALGQALSAELPEFQQEVDDLLLSAGMSGGVSLRQAMPALVNAAASAPAPRLLVLDDLHEISNPAIYAALAALLAHLPAGLHLAISTRHTPPLRLSRLRARRQVIECLSGDLRFDLDETRQLNALLELRLAEAELVELHRRTEGWVAGMILLARRPRPPSDVERHPGLVDASSFDYLAEEVLAGQPETLRRFLLETSILEEFTPRLCYQVTGHSRAGEWLEELYRRNLFISRTAEEADAGPRYRYHSLFAAFLRSELQRASPERCLELHRRAARLVGEPGRALQHWLAAQEWQPAADLLESTGEAYFQQGRQETLAAWLARLPGEVVAQRPRLGYLRAMSLLLRGDIPAAQAAIDAALQAPAPGAARGALLVGAGALAFLRADFIACARHIAQAEAQALGPAEQIHFRMLRTSLALFAGYYERGGTGSSGRASHDLAEAITLARAADEPFLWYLLSLYLGPEFTHLPGALEQIEAAFQQSLERYGEKAAPLRLGLGDTLAGVHLRRGRLRQAIQTGRAALAAKAQLGGYTFLGINACLAISSACAALGDYAAAEQAAQRLLAQAADNPLNRALTGGGLFPLARLHWLQGRCDEAQLAYLELVELEPKLPHVHTLQAMLAGMLEMSARRFAAAEKHLLAALEMQRQEEISQVYASARLLLAALYQRWDQPRQALEYLESALARSQRDQTPGDILQEMPLIAPLLRLAVTKNLRAGQAAELLEQAGLAGVSPASAAPLTARQMEVLRLVAAGYSNQAIADALVLSLPTVKSHLANIMDRLGASSRGEAAAFAREMGLL